MPALLPGLAAQMVDFKRSRCYQCRQSTDCSNTAIAKHLVTSQLGLPPPPPLALEVAQKNPSQEPARPSSQAKRGEAKLRFFVLGGGPTSSANWQGGIVTGCWLDLVGGDKLWWWTNSFILSSSSRMLRLGTLQEGRWAEKRCKRSYHRGQVASCWQWLKTCSVVFDQLQGSSPNARRDGHDRTGRFFSTWSVLDYGNCKDMGVVQYALYIPYPGHGSQGT